MASRLVCEYCGERVTKSESQLRAYPRTFCDRRCAALWRWQKHPPKRRSPIWRIKKDELTAAYCCAESIRDLLVRIGVRPVAGNYKTLKQRLVYEGLDARALAAKGNLARSATLTKHGRRLPDDVIFIEQSRVDRSTVRARMQERAGRDGWPLYSCAVCGQDPEWNGQALSLVLDHINGINNDHRRDNLRWLCPNCNSQTDTFGSRNRIQSTRSL